MDPQRALPDTRPSQARLVWSFVGLAAALVGAWPAFALYGYWRAEGHGVLSATVALAICGGAAIASLVVTVMGQRAQQPIGGILGGMLVRMAVPFLALIALPKWNSALAESGLQGMLLGYYLLGLGVETWILVRLVPSPPGSAKAA